VGGKLAGEKMTADSEPGGASIVPMAANHLGDVAAVCKELGYDAQTEDVGARFGELKNDPDSGLIAAGGRHRGHGSRLLARAEAWAPEWGLSRMVIYSAGKWVDAHAFYSCAGYRAMPEVHKHAKSLGGPGNKAAG
jgi:GNAT superfamily N-acetyltransferase